MGRAQLIGGSVITGHGGPEEYKAHWAGHEEQASDQNSFMASASVPTVNSCFDFPSATECDLKALRNKNPFFPKVLLSQKQKVT